MMGAGKTSVGEKLSAELKVDFLDLDKFIEEQTAMTIAELFNRMGEDSFRSIEKEALRNVTNKYPKSVIACGGGTPCFFDNIEFINATGISFYLRVKPEVLYARITESKVIRPLINSEEDKLALIKKLLESRERYYSKSNYTIDTDQLNSNEVAEFIKSIILPK